MTARELRDAIDAAIAENPAAADLPVFATQAYTERALTVFAVTPIAITIETETVDSAPCACGGLVSYLADHDRAAATSNMSCDTCADPRPVDL